MVSASPSVVLARANSVRVAKGMVMLVEVGKGANADAAKAAKMPPKAKQKFDELFAAAAK